MKEVLAGPWGCVTRTVGSHERGGGWSLGLCHKNSGQS